MQDLVHERVRTRVRENRSEREREWMNYSLIWYTIICDRERGELCLFQGRIVFVLVTKNRQNNLILIDFNLKI